MAKRSAKGASRTLSESVKTLEAHPEGIFTHEDLKRAREAILANLSATRLVGTARNGFREVPDEATRQRAAEVILKLGFGEVTRTKAETEAQTEEDSSPKRAAPASELPINPELERRILKDRLEVLDKSAETARN
jgi:hypothetical protein